MEVVVKKFQQKFKKAREEMDRWDQLQSRLIAEFGSASSIIESLEILQDASKHGELKSFPGFRETILENKMMSFETVLRYINETMKGFHGIVLSLEKILRDGRQLIKGGARPLSESQMRLRVGIQPSVADCLEGLRLLHEMHRDEYNCKLLVVSKLMPHEQPNASSLGNLQQLVVDQPNIPKEEVKSILDIMFAEEIC